MHPLALLLGASVWFSLLLPPAFLAHGRYCLGSCMLPLVFWPLKYSILKLSGFAFCKRLPSRSPLPSQSLWFEDKLVEFFLNGVISFLYNCHLWFLSKLEVERQGPDAEQM